MLLIWSVEVAIACLPAVVVGVNWTKARARDTQAARQIIMDVAVHTDNLDDNGDVLRMAIIILQRSGLIEENLHTRGAVELNWPLSLQATDRSTRKQLQPILAIYGTVCRKLLD